eukprot:TRINITY_DN1956_c0_g1_i1.p1 TRINITY_DN1956_c0_g1~~TRINITY_DN1956_c0_g1_i1.p1  ORF type:complete len:1033 (-),score=213.22 TRINITY_DN1956_c0_g1_i1:775-3873(-)
MTLKYYLGFLNERSIEYYQKLVFDEKQIICSIAVESDVVVIDCTEMNIFSRFERQFKDKIIVHVCALQIFIKRQMAFKTRTCFSSVFVDQIFAVLGFNEREAGKIADLIQMNGGQIFSPNKDMHTMEYECLQIIVPDEGLELSNFVFQAKKTCMYRIQFLYDLMKYLLNYCKYYVKVPAIDYKFFLEKNIDPIGYLYPALSNLNVCLYHVNINEEDAIQKIESLGGKVSRTFTVNTDFIFDDNITVELLDYAKTLGCRVVNSSWLVDDCRTPFLLHQNERVWNCEALFSLKKNKIIDSSNFIGLKGSIYNCPPPALWELFKNITFWLDIPVESTTCSKTSLEQLIFQYGGTIEKDIMKAHFVISCSQKENHDLVTDGWRSVEWLFLCMASGTIHPVLENDHLFRCSKIKRFDQNSDKVICLIGIGKHFWTWRLYLTFSVLSLGFQCSYSPIVTSFCIVWCFPKHKQYKNKNSDMNGQLSRISKLKRKGFCIVDYAWLYDCLDSGVLLKFDDYVLETKDVSENVIQIPSNSSKSVKSRANSSRPNLNLFGSISQPQTEFEKNFDQRNTFIRTDLNESPPSPVSVDMPQYSSQISQGESMYDRTRSLIAFNKELPPLKSTPVLQKLEQAPNKMVLSNLRHSPSPLRSQPQVSSHVLRPSIGASQKIRNSESAILDSVAYSHLSKHSEPSIPEVEEQASTKNSTKILLDILREGLPNNRTNDSFKEFEDDVPMILDYVGDYNFDQTQTYLAPTVDIGYGICETKSPVKSPIKSTGKTDISSVLDSGSSQAPIYIYAPSLSDHYLRSLEKCQDRFNVEIVDNHMEATIGVVSKLSRDRSILYLIAQGLPILVEQWLSECLKREQLVNYRPYEYYTFFFQSEKYPKELLRFQYGLIKPTDKDLAKAAHERRVLRTKHQRLIFDNIQRVFVYLERREASYICDLLNLGGAQDIYTIRNLKHLERECCNNPLPPQNQHENQSIVLCVLDEGMKDCKEIHSYLTFCSQYIVFVQQNWVVDSVVNPDVEPLSFQHYVFEKK